MSSNKGKDNEQDPGRDEENIGEQEEEPNSEDGQEGTSNQNQEKSRKRAHGGTAEKDRDGRQKKQRVNEEIQVIAETADEENAQLRNENNNLHGIIDALREEIETNQVIAQSAEDARQVAENERQIADQAEIARLRHLLQTRPEGNNAQQVQIQTAYQGGDAGQEMATGNTKNLDDVQPASNPSAIGSDTIVDVVGIDDDEQSIGALQIQKLEPIIRQNQWMRRNENMEEVWTSL